MKKALWFLSALALAGFGMVACDGDDSEPCGGCPENTACVKVQNAADACMDGAQILTLVGTGCLDAETGNWVAGWAVILDDGDYVCVEDDEDYGRTCTTSDQCSGNTPYCDPDQHICTANPVEPEYKYVLIQDLSAKCSGKCTKEDPGADIDAVALIKSGKQPVYAVAWKGYLRSDGVSSKKDDEKYAAADPQAALGQPDAIDSYAVDNSGVGTANGNCNYFKPGTDNIGRDAECKANKDSCQWDYTFVSLGGEGGYIILEMGDKIEAGDKIDVLEVGDCTLQNTASGSHDNAQKEKMRVSVSVAYDYNGTWKQIGEKDGATNGIASFTVSGTNL